jgi:hypothetical protein
MADECEFKPKNWGLLINFTNGKTTGYKSNTYANRTDK